MVETDELYNIGIRSGAIDGDGIIVGTSQDWKRIVAPLTSDMSCYSLIFWESTDQESKPALDKIVCNFILFSFILKSVA